MKVVYPHIKKISFHIPEGFESQQQFIEWVGRTCYKSEDKITNVSASAFVKMLRNRGHWPMFDHCFSTVKFIADRGFTHELVRHRIAAYAQESTRYCNYSLGRFDGEITIISLPEAANATVEQTRHYMAHMLACEKAYMEALESGLSTGFARMYLPIGLKAEIVMTASLTEWRHVFKVRTTEQAHLIMSFLALSVLAKFAKKLPEIFDV